MRIGVVGMKLGQCEIVTNKHGYQTTPFPKIDLNSNRKALNTLRRIDEWLITNAYNFSSMRNDDFMKMQFQQMSKNLKNLSQSDKDCAEYYLFS